MYASNHEEGEDTESNFTEFLLHVPCFMCMCILTTLVKTEKKLTAPVDRFKTNKQTTKNKPDPEDEARSMNRGSRVYIKGCWAISQWFSHSHMLPDYVMSMKAVL